MFLNLYSNCQVTEGSHNSSLLDLQRGDIYLINKELCEALKPRYINLRETKLSKKVLEKYTAFLLDNDLAYLSERKEFQNDIDMEWDYPASISNAIVELKFLDLSLMKLIIDQLDELLCSHIEIRIYNEILNYDKLKSLNQIINRSKLNSFDLFLGQGNEIQFLFEEYNEFKREELFSYFTMLGKVVFFSSKTDDSFYFHGRTVIQTQQELNNKMCGLILPQFFSVNMRTYAESLKHNTCLNRKISVDINGKIKNCPSFKESHGSIFDTKLKDVLAIKSFNKYWDINKDKINVCNTCEFRRVCTDCRAFIEKPDDNLSKPLKCGYNPDTGEWQEWSTNPLKQKAIKLYNLI